MNAYDRGDTIRFTAKVSKAEVSTAPGMAFAVSVTNGTPETFNPQTAHTATEWRWLVDYYVSPTADLGKWAYKFTASGSAAQVQTGEFLVRAPRL